MPNGTNRNSRVPSWFAVVLALASLVIGGGAGSGSVLYVVSSGYATKHAMEAQKKEIHARISSVKSDLKEDQDSLDNSITRLSHEISALKSLISQLNISLARLETKLEDENDR